MNKNWLSPKVIKIAALLMVAVISMTVLSPVLSNPDMHRSAYRVLNGQKDQAAFLTGFVTLASTGLSLLPDDAATPLADELSEMSTPLMIIVCAIVLEKMLLTLFEGFAFSMMIPAACVLTILYLIRQRKVFFIWAMKIALMGILFAIIIPLSVQVVAMINASFATMVQETLAPIYELESTFKQVIESKNVLDLLSNIGSSVGGLLTASMSILSVLIDSVAFLLITSCIIPIITVLLFVWGIKSILVGKMENLHDTTMDIIKKIPRKEKKKLPEKAA